MTIRKLRRMLKLGEVLMRRGRSRPQHYVDVNNGVYTHPVKITPGGQAVGYPDYEVDELEHAMLAGWDEAQVKALVTELEQARRAPRAVATHEAAEQVPA